VTVLDDNTLGMSLSDRFSGIDCPELSHKYGQEAASFVKEKMAGSEVVVKLY
jgi:endonuclease YncB( thermonuclease family)